MLSFVLSMPGVGSWNGKWTAESNFYAKVINFGKSKKATEKAQAILDQGYFSYNFGDGWCAGITIKEVTAAEARKIRGKSKGFAGYDWMIDSIRADMEIRAELRDKDRKVVGYQNSHGQTVYTDGREEERKVDGES